MVDLPRELTDEALDELLVPGRVFLFKSFPGRKEVKPKIFVVLSPPGPKGGVYYTLTTTQHQFYDNHPDMAAEIVRIPRGTHGFLSDPENSIIQCHFATMFKVERLRELYNVHEFVRLGELSEDVLKSVLESIVNSKLLPIKYKTDISQAIREHLNLT